MFQLLCTDRQKEYFTYLLRGYNPREIAELMGVKLGQVQVYRSGIIKRNRCHTLEKLIIKFFSERQELLAERLSELKSKNKELKEVNKTLEKENKSLKKKLGKYQNGI